MSDGPYCAHLKIEWRTKQVPYEGPEIPGNGQYAPIKPGTMMTKGWWECAYGCGTVFTPVKPDVSP